MQLHLKWQDYPKVLGTIKDWKLILRKKPDHYFHYFKWFWVNTEMLSKLADTMEVEFRMVGRKDWCSTTVWDIKFKGKAIQQMAYESQLVMRIEDMTNHYWKLW